MAPANNDGNTGLIPRFLGQALFNSFATSELLLVFLEADRKAAVADRIGTVSGDHGGLAPAKVGTLFLPCKPVHCPSGFCFFVWASLFDHQGNHSSGSGFASPLRRVNALD